jgi:putative phosphoribosyl transferase
MFQDRKDAGSKLGLELSHMQLHRPVVLALPRGGVPVAAEVARALNAPLDLLIVRKVGAPGNPELAVAAIVDGDPGDVVLNREMVEAYALDEDSLRALIAEQRPELERRRVMYRGNTRPVSVAGRTVIIVDDGAATGTSMKIAIRALKRRSPKQIIAAVPVAPPETVAELAREADRVVCLSEPLQFRALSYHYLRFPQLSDGEVLAAMNQAALLQQGRKPGKADPAQDGGSKATSEPTAHRRKGK